jgi:hypothetical protein
MKQLIKKYGWNKLYILSLLILTDILLIHNMYNGIIPKLENIFAVLAVLISITILGILTIGCDN